MDESFTIRSVKIIDVIFETKNAKTFVLEFLDSPEPGYKAGQFLTLVFYTRHGEKRRSYSISSSPALKEPLSITVKKIENGEFSRLLISHAKVGDILYTSGVNGFFHLPVDIDNYVQYFFIAAGSGVTPCLSMMKTILATAHSNVVLIYSNKNEEDAIFYEQLKRLLHRYAGRFKARFLFSDIFDVNLSRLSKRLLLIFLQELLTVDAAQALFYVCGPHDYMQMINITLLEKIPAQNILRENFNTLPRLIIPKPPDILPHTVSISINQRLYKVTVQYPVTILAAAKKNKINLPYSCEAGRCGSCVATCTSGKVWMAYNEILTDDELAKGRVLVCQGYPVEGDVEIVF